MTLLDLKCGETVKVKTVGGGKALLERLRGFGVFVGRRFRLVKCGPFAGPLLLEDAANGARVLLGRGMAGKVEVERESL
ncbi:MAG: FeoA family protein [candidate division FCPU426 bacterium]